VDLLYNLLHVQRIHNKSNKWSLSLSSDKNCVQLHSAKHRLRAHAWLLKISVLALLVFIKSMTANMRRVICCDNCRYKLDARPITWCEVMADAPWTAMSHWQRLHPNTPASASDPLCTRVKGVFIRKFASSWYPELAYPAVEFVYTLMNINYTSFLWGYLLMQLFL
jgi:hypothetical protein